ncbi:MAG: DUF362 domain-containing protein [Desulfatibacillaceae bacterium]
MQVVESEYSGDTGAVDLALDRLGAGDVLAGQKRILLKPNLVTASAFPVTTDPAFCEAVLRYVRGCTEAEVVIAEGTGEPGYSTHEVFETLGYGEMARRHGADLVDLNEEPCTVVRNPECSVFPEMHLPEIAFTHFIISLPVLKAHSLSVFTGTLKNMMGFAPPQHYSGTHGYWKKAVFHGNMQDGIRDLCVHRAPDLTVLDASVGLCEFHLGGRHCDPPVGRILAGFDPLGVDRRAAELLGIDWSRVGHLAEDHPYNRRFS